MFDFSNELMLANADLKGLNKCFSPVTREYAKGEIITICSPDYDKIGIIKKGLVYLSTENFEEQRRIFDYYQSGDFFGIHFLPITDEKLFFLSAKTKCTVDFIKYDKLLNCCENNCQKHIMLIDKLLVQTAKRNSVHLDIMGQRSLRSKLLAFFEHLKADSKSNTFKIPIPYSDVADYIGVDRSAMMREIKKLETEKIIATNKRKVTII